jgi:DeoR family transcriptional regulator, suf operon transcriptional repressor
MNDASTKQEILNYLLKRAQATAQELAKHLGVSPQAIRRHLKDLETEDWIQFETVQVQVGRPRHVYQLSEKGRHRFPDRHDEFAVSLLDAMAETVGPDGMRTILRQQWQRKAQDYRQQLGQGALFQRVQELVRLRRAEGYMAECYPLPADIELPLAKQFILTEYNCAISHVAESFPSVCDHELEMFTIALQDCTVERTHWLVNGEHRCGYLIQAYSEVVTA